MPITCPIDFVPLSTEEFGSLDYAIMKHAFETHQDLGSLADETIYQNDFWNRLQDAGYDTEREVPVHVTFDTFKKDYFLDLVVNRRAVYELKTVASLTDRHAAQLLNYLLLLDLQRGKLVNFRPMSVESQFVNAPLVGAERRRYSIHTEDWSGPMGLLDLLRQLLFDWGTGLELSLYNQAIGHLWGNGCRADALLEMSRDGKPLGHQRFHLASPDSAFRLTAFSDVSNSYPSQLSRLLLASPLEAIHWINIAYHDITCRTIQR
ncbi:GxxExxY protein [Roseimaritima ulvae]|uniref:GxxExxY protein n=1 Tax=Roseimaritima ulvae TaxID=980254 RepID=A0A5B9QM56_9BACT|nr:GxxExxY protein [Roseimaritima ulvae]QEG39129.1 hypothetical protein UC8_10900 [Roseimaritima ulvae]